MTSATTDTAEAGKRTAASPGRRHPRRRSRRWPVLAVLLVVLVVAVFIATRGNSQSFVLGSARHGTVSETVAVSGALQPSRTWSVYFHTAGTVATVAVSAGQHVHRDQILATLSARPLEDQVSSAQAAVSADQAKLTADQARLSADQAKLDGEQAKQAASKAKTPTQSTAEAALITADQNAITADQSATTADQDAHTAAEQQLTTAEANLAAATLRAPAAATVEQVNVAPGQNIGSAGGGGAGSAGAGGSNQASTSGSTANTSAVGANAAIILANSSLQAIGQVSDSQISEVRVGQHAIVTPAGQTAAISGRVEEITPTATSSGGVTTYPIKIGWSGHHRAGVLAGMSAQISVVIARTAGLTVPSSAVHTSGTHSWVMVLSGARVRNGRARGGQESRQPIAAGPSGGGLTIVRSGLRAGEQVVLADNSTPLPTSAGNLKSSGKGSQVRKLLG